jgi:hypothetical protein
MHLSLINMLGLCQVNTSHIQHVIENLIYNIYKSSVSTGSAKQIMPILFILHYNSSLVTSMVISLTIIKFKTLIFSVSGFALSYTTNIFILIILHDFYLSPAEFCYIIIYLWKIEICVQITDRCEPWQFPSGAEHLVLQALQL